MHALPSLFRTVGVTTALVLVAFAAFFVASRGLARVMTVRADARKRERPPETSPRDADVILRALHGNETRCAKCGDLICSGERVVRYEDRRRTAPSWTFRTWDDSVLGCVRTHCLDPALIAYAGAWDGEKFVPASKGSVLRPLRKPRDGWHEDGAEDEE